MLLRLSAGLQEHGMQARSRENVSAVGGLG